MRGGFGKGRHRRTPVNEVLGTRLASPPGLPTAPVKVVEAPEELDETLSNALQLAQKGTYASDLDAEMELVYANHVAPLRGAARVGAAGSRADIRSYCAQVLKQARLWERVEKGVHAEEFTFPGDPPRIDYGYRRNGTRGFVQALRFRARGGPHPREGEVQRVYRRDRHPPDRGKRTAPVRAGNAM